MPSLLLLEGLPKYEGVREARIIHYSLQVFKKSMDGRRARYLKLEFKQPNTKIEFLGLLESDVEYIRISAHGRKEDGKGRFFVKSKATIGSEDIHSLDIKACVLFLSACETWTDDLASAFLEASQARKRVYIAPRNNISPIHPPILEDV